VGLTWEESGPQEVHVQKPEQYRGRASLGRGAGTGTDAGTGAVTLVALAGLTGSAAAVRRMPVPPPSGKKHNYSTLVQPEHSFPTDPSLLATALDPQPVTNSATAASRCSSENELPLNMKLLPVSLLIQLSGSSSHGRPFVVFPRQKTSHGAENEPRGNDARIIPLQQLLAMERVYVTGHVIDAECDGQLSDVSDP